MLAYPLLLGHVGRYERMMQGVIDLHSGSLGFAVRVRDCEAARDGGETQRRRKVAEAIARRYGAVPHALA